MKCRVGLSSLQLHLALASLAFPSMAAPQSLQLPFQTEEQDRARDRNMPVERVLDLIGLRPGLVVGEAGAWYGYYTLKLSRRVGPSGRVYANDINPAALRTIEARCAASRITNIQTVLGIEVDPRFPRSDLDLILVGDCLHMFGRPAEWMAQARKYLRPGGRLVILDAERSKMRSDSFLSRGQVLDFARRAGYTVVEVEDGFLESHMILVLQAPSAVGSR